MITLEATSSPAINSPKSGREERMDLLRNPRLGFTVTVEATFLHIHALSQILSLNVLEFCVTSKCHQLKPIFG